MAFGDRRTTDDDSSDDDDPAFRGRTGEVSGSEETTSDTVDDEPMDDSASSGAERGFPSGGSSDDIDDDDDDDETVTITPPDEETGQGIEDDRRDREDSQPPPEDQPPDVRAEDSPGGSGVTGSEAQQLLDSGVTVRDLQDRPALASQLERITGVDARELDLGENQFVALDDGTFSIETDRRAAARDLERQAANDLGLNERQIRIEETDSGLRALPNQSGAFELQRRSLEEEYGIPESEIRQTDRGLTVGIETAINTGLVDIKQNIEAQRRGAFGEGRTKSDAVNELERELESKTGQDLQQGRDFLVEETAKGYEARLTEAFQRQEATKAFTDRFEEETGASLDAGEDFTIEKTDEGKFKANLTDEGRIEVRATGNERFGDIPVNLADESSDRIARASDATLGVTTVEGPGERLERTLARASQQYDNFIDRLAEYEAKDTGLNAASDAYDRSDGGESLNPALTKSIEENTAIFAEKGAKSLNVPELALGIKEGIEYGFEAGSQTARTPGTASTQVAAASDTVITPETRIKEDRGGDIQEFGSDSIDVAAEGVEAFAERAKERPINTAAAVAGSLVATGGVMGGAAKLSKGAGLATRGLIQPGEELAGIGGNKVTRAVAGGKTAERLFPANEPLIFSEEAAIRGSKRLAGEIKPKALRGLELSKGRFEANLRNTKSSATELSNAIRREVNRYRYPRPSMRSAEIDLSREPGAQIGEAFDIDSGGKEIYGEFGEGSDIESLQYSREPVDMGESESVDEDVDAMGGDATDAIVVDVRQGNLFGKMELEQKTGYSTEMARPGMFELEAELETEADRMVDTEISTETETATRSEAMFESASEPMFDFERALEPAVSEREATKPETRALERELPQELEREQEIPQEIERETEIPREFEIEQYEQELERELEVELETEKELESELEAALPGPKQKAMKRDSDTSGNIFSDVFKNAVVSPDELSKIDKEVLRGL